MSKKINPLASRDISDIQVLVGEDNYYWLYSKKNDMYLPTPYSIYYMTKKDCLDYMMECPEQWEEDWCKYEDIIT